MKESNPTIISESQSTICAISTPPGVGGIAVIRVSGPEAIEIVDKIWQGKPLAEAKSHTAHLGNLIDPSRDRELLDQAVATLFRAPASFTGENVVELSVHGSRYVQRRLLEVLINSGARLAEAGEFTRRAFANGKMDLAQAEAVADVIASNSRAAHRLAASQMKGVFSRRLEELRGKLLDLASLLELELDFSEEEVEFASRARLRDIATEIYNEVSRLEKSFSAGSVIKEGIPVAIVGQTNVGKSSLLNLLLGEDRAIVSDIHGTTRDTIEDTLEIGDYLFRFIDTAGLRETTDPIEALGMERSRQALAKAAIIISVVDVTNQSDAQIEVAMEGVKADVPTILLLNKSDLLGADAHNIIETMTSAIAARTDSNNLTTINFSTKTGQGHQQLLSTLSEIADELRGSTDEDTLLVTNIRHANALREAAASSAAVIEGLRLGIPGDLIAQDLRATLHHLSSITGTLTTPDILASIFSRFCIGK